MGVRAGRSWSLVTIDELVAESCQAQDVPFHVEDPEILAQVAAVIRSGGEAPQT
jgi:hypothetical protein